MDHQTRFKQKVLPHYLKVITEVVTLDDIVSNCSDLSRVENRLRTAVTTAHTEIRGAVAEGKKVDEDVNNEIRDAMEEKRKVQQEMENKRKQLLKVGNELITLETEKEKKQAKLKQVQATILQKEETREAEYARKAEKETLRNVGFGLFVLPFVGLPLALGATREMKRSEQLISQASEKLSTMMKEQDCVCQELTDCQKKVEELRLEQQEVDNQLRGNEVDLQVKQGHITQLCASRMKVFNSMDHLNTLQTELDLVYEDCDPDNYPGINLVQKLQDLVSLVQSQSFGLELLGDPRVVSKLSQLDGRCRNGAPSLPEVCE
ncbi:uncharacterized protein LOC132402559 [Hypanus sabinus]|uniref:uncharacterized protein LOC132402559 n=1 Tax=Hypanus sabinus TaxID=79690 RepID=UPI0028C4FAAD|nr:uncharacterized protein LOC132402559 [Hypanus sabinus]